MVPPVVIRVTLRTGGTLSRPAGGSERKLGGAQEGEALEATRGFEPATPTLARLCSTTELFPPALLTVLVRLLPAAHELQRIVTAPQAVKSSPTTSSRKGEGVADESIAPAVAFPVETEDVEAAGEAVEALGGALGGQVEGGGAADLALLAGVHGGDRRTEGVARPGLDLQEAEGLSFLRHDVDLSGVVDQVALDDLVAVRGEPADGVLLPHPALRPAVRLAVEVRHQRRFQRVPWGVSSSRMPRPASSSRMRSDSAKSRRWRASLRAWINPSISSSSVAWWPGAAAGQAAGSRRPST